jgi:uncharacterized protein YbjT (DUF2867 family)
MLLTVGRNLSPKVNQAIDLYPFIFLGKKLFDLYRFITFFVMKKILIVGATGQLGTAVFEKLAKSGQYDLRIFVRKDAKYDHLLDADPELAFGDLTDRASIESAVQGCDVIISTANAVVPRKKTDTFQSVDKQGYQDLIALARDAGVQQFIYTSVAPFRGKVAGWVPLAQAKEMTEMSLKKSGVNYTIFQPDTFMDFYFAAMGSTLPVKNEPAALVNRPWKFIQNFYNGVKNDIENGKINLIGSGNTRHSYICIDNVADFLVKSVDNPDMLNATYKIGGPESLSGLEVKTIFEKVLNKKLEVKKTPAIMMKIMGNVFSLFNEQASNIFKLNYAEATVPSVVNCQVLADELGIRLISAEEYLRQKAEDRSPVVS